MKFLCETCIFLFTCIAQSFWFASAGILTINTTEVENYVVSTSIVDTFLEGGLFERYPTFEVRGEVVVLTSDILAQMETSNTNSSTKPYEQLKNKLLYIPASQYDQVRFMCGYFTDYWEEYACSFAVICSYKPQAIVQASSQQAWYMPKRWLSQHGKYLLAKHNVSKDCKFFRSYDTTYANVSRLEDGDLAITGKLVVDDSSLDFMRSHYTMINRLYFCYVASIVFLVLAGLALYFAARRYQSKRLNSVFILLYILNGTTCIVLSIVFCLGPFFLFDARSATYEQIQYATYDLFLGISCATDYISTILYVHVTSRISKRSTPTTSDHLIRQYPLMLSIGVLMALANLASACILIQTHVPVLVLQLVVFYLPIVEIVLQVSVLVYVVRRVSLVTQQLKSSRLVVSKAAREDSSYKGSMLRQVSLEKQMRFWVKVSALGSVLSLLALFLFFFTTSLPMGMYSIICALATFGKQVNVLGQLMITKPMSATSVAAVHTTATKSTKPV